DGKTQALGKGQQAHAHNQPGQGKGGQQTGQQQAESTQKNQWQCIVDGLTKWNFPGQAGQGQVAQDQAGKNGNLGFGIAQIVQAKVFDQKNRRQSDPDQHG